ncbi:glycosyltransferase family 2 protein [Candidatus Peregrinibacteria bacterium]|nr:glycosyltransferase family 2 protein [Candidatus Peregrinibacteria bacterium]
MASISIIIINYNGAAYIEKCLSSALKNSFEKKDIIVIDNASSDDSVKKMKDAMGRENFSQKNKIIVKENSENFGYSKAANQGIRLAKGDYIMILNPDALLEKDYIQTILDYAEKNKIYGAFTGKLLKYDIKTDTKIPIIDSTGLYCFRNRRIIDREQGLQDKNEGTMAEDIFGVSGACPIYRKKALEDVKINGEYFDEDFFMYKEDIDISWRMRLLGWNIAYIPKAVAYHARGTGVLKRFTHFEVAKNRIHLSRFQKSLAYRNQRLMQIKNELASNFLHDFPHILWKEILIMGYILLREPYLLISIFQFMKMAPSAWKKRKMIMARKKVSAGDMQKWFHKF